MDMIKPGLYQLIIHNFAKSAWILEMFGPRYIRMIRNVFHHKLFTINLTYGLKSQFLMISRN